MVTYIFGLLVFVAGVIIGSFTLVQCLVILKFGIPTTIRLKNLKVIESLTPLVTYIVTFATLTLGLLLTVLCVYKFLSTYFIPYTAGLMGVYILGMGSFGSNQNNIVSFMESKLNRKYFLKDISGEDFEYIFDPMKNHSDSLDGDELFARTLGDTVFNAIFYGICTLATYTIGQYLHWVGILLLVILGFLVLFSTTQFLIMVGTSLKALINSQKGDNSISSIIYSFLCILISGIEKLIVISYCFFLYKVFF